MAFKKGKAQGFPPDYEEQPGMNNSQRDKDASTGWPCDDSMFHPKFEVLGECSGPDVGSPYDNDADMLGEERHRITHKGKGGKSYKKD